jgi:glutathione S-transferase
MFAAIDTIEPPVIEMSLARILERDKPWFDARQPMLEERVRGRLGELSERLGDAEWLDGGFSAGDLMMVTVLRRAAAMGVLAAYPALAAYVARGEARPAYRRAFADQRAVFEASTPVDG